MREKHSIEFKAYIDEAEKDLKYKEAKNDH